MKTISISVLSIKSSIQEYDKKKDYAELWNALKKVIDSTIVLTFEEGWEPYIHQMPRKGYSLMYRDAGHDARGCKIQYVKEDKLTKDELKSIENGSASICCGSGSLFYKINDNIDLNFDDLFEGLLNK